MRKIDLNNFQVATSGTVRDINTRIMLDLLREHQWVIAWPMKNKTAFQPVDPVCIRN